VGQGCTIYNPQLEPVNSSLCSDVVFIELFFKDFIASCNENKQ
jgi:hypothetical protein